MRWIRAAVPVLILIAAAASVRAADMPAAVPPAPAGRGVRTLILVRHGVYDDADPADPDVGKALTNDGREQAALTGIRLTNFPFHIDALHASTMTRARQTAEIIGKALKMTPQPSRLIRECTPPTEREDVMRDQKPGEPEACVDTLELAWARFFRPSPAKDSTEVLVAHANVIRWLTSKALGLDAKLWLRMTLGNCSITVIRVRSDGKCQVMAVGDVGHLPNRLQERLWFPAPPTAARADTAAKR
jgi:serine/threonine-protein phosphatase PGAM5